MSDWWEEKAQEIWDMLPQEAKERIAMSNGTEPPTKVEILIKPVGRTSTNPYRITFESTAPCHISAKLAKEIAKLLQREYMTQGVRKIKYEDWE